MKSSIRQLLIFGILLLVVMGNPGCRKSLSELNENPNETLSTDPDFLFRYALIRGISSYNSDVNLHQWGLMTWMMYFAPRGGVEAGKEYIVPTGKDAFWTEQYADALGNLNELILLTADNPALSNHNAAARIWRVWLFHRLTDLWGEIPYSDALQGMTDLNYTPFYDTQETIYRSMLSELQSAAAQLDANASFFGSSVDLLCRGDVMAWRKFANSLRLRLATRIRDRLPAEYAAQMLDLSSQPLISSNAENILFPYSYEKKNPVYEAMFTGQAVIQNNPSKFLVDLLVSSNDPRLPILLQKAPMSILPWIPPYNGVPNLLTTSDPAWSNYNLDDNWGDISRIGKWFLRDETPGILISYPEVCFLQAEAALNGAWAGSAQTFYEEGTAAAIRLYDVPGDTSYYVPESEIQTYINSLPAADLQQIITQKWILFAYDNAYEAWAEYRRTSYPRFTRYDGSFLGNNDIPARLTYPNAENTLNNEHYNEAVGRQGADHAYTKVWWDVF